MKITATPEATARFKKADFASRIFLAGNGKGLLKFCSELAVLLTRRYSLDDDARNLREELSESLEATLQCSKHQVDCIIDISLEMIHAKVHGKYRRSDLELSYLIAIATGAVEDVRAN